MGLGTGTQTCQLLGQARRQVGDRPWSLPGLSVLWGFALPSQPCLLPTSTSPWGKKSSSRSGEQDPHNEQVHIMRVRAPTQPSCFPLSAGWGSPPFPVLSSQKGPNGRPGQGRGGWAGSLKEQPSWYCYFCSAPTGVVVAPPCSDYGPRTQHRRGSTQVGLKSHAGLRRNASSCRQRAEFLPGSQELNSTQIPGEDTKCQRETKQASLLLTLCF